MGIVCPVDRYPQLEKYISELTLDSYECMTVA